MNNQQFSPYGFFQCWKCQIIYTINTSGGATATCQISDSDGYSVI